MPGARDGVREVRQNLSCVPDCMRANAGIFAVDGTSGTGCYTDDMLHSQGSVYDDGAVVTGDICVAVPTDKVPGGLWRVSNSVNDSVWIASS